MVMATVGSGRRMDNEVRMSVEKTLYAFSLFLRFSYSFL
jgi:hypothetical protein